MTKRIINPAGAAPAGGPYSRAVRLGDLLFCAGQIAIVPETGEMLLGDVKAQTQQVLQNINVILKDQGLAPSHVVKATVFMTNLAFFNDMNEVYGRFFESNFPARTCVQVAALPKGAQVEIEVIAHY
jgi:2-iminobutanoate/2-iminopropanoate deaminase